MNDVLEVKRVRGQAKLTNNMLNNKIWSNLFAITDAGAFGQNMTEAPEFYVT
jgi:hypothetical protein